MAVSTSTMRIGIAIGDVTGVGPEVALKAVAAESQRDDAKYFFIGDETILERLPLKLPLKKLAEGGEGKFFTTNPFPKKLPAGLPKGATLAAKAAMASLKDAAGRCLRRELDAMVTAPVNKEAIVRAGFKGFVGQTEFLSELAGAKRTAMMLLGHDDKGRWLRVALATIHVSIKSVSKKLTAEKVKLAIELAARACREFGLLRAAVAVAGLNPQAGEGGEFGDEEI